MAATINSMDSNKNLHSDKQAEYTAFAINNSLKQCHLNFLNDYNEIYPGNKKRVEKEINQNIAVSPNFDGKALFPREELETCTSTAASASVVASTPFSNFEDSSRSSFNPLAISPVEFLNDVSSQDTNDTIISSTSEKQNLICNKCHFQITDMSQRIGLLSGKKDVSNPFDPSNVFLKMNKEVGNRNVHKRAIRCSSCMNYFHSV